MVKLMSNDEFNKLNLKKISTPGNQVKLRYFSQCPFWYCVVNIEVSSTSSQIVEQIEVVQEVVFSGISKLNDSALDKK